MAVIVVAEDDPNLRALVRVVLARSGHTVFTAADGREVIELLDTVAADLVISDHEMPRLNGTELHRVMCQRVETAAIPLIVLSAFDASSEVQALGRVVAGCIYKPFEPEALIQLVNDVLPPADADAPPAGHLSGN